MDYVFGFTCVNDVTARDFQKEDGTYAQSKGFNTFCPIGPWIKKTKQWDNRNVKCFVNQKIRQEGNSNDLLFSVPKLISFVSHIFTLYSQISLQQELLQESVHYKMEMLWMLLLKASVH